MHTKGRKHVRLMVLQQQQGRVQFISESVGVLQQISNLQWTLGH